MVYVMNGIDGGIICTVQEGRVQQGINGLVVGSLRGNQVVRGWYGEVVATISGNRLLRGYNGEVLATVMTDAREAANTCYAALAWMQPLLPDERCTIPEHYLTGSHRMPDREKWLAAALGIGRRNRRIRKNDDDSERQ